MSGARRTRRPIGLPFGGDAPAPPFPTSSRTFERMGTRMRVRESAAGFAMLGAGPQFPANPPLRPAADAPTRRPFAARAARANVMRLSIVIPALEEAAGIAATLAPLQTLRALGHEVIVVDGGSRDATRCPRPRSPTASSRPRGRARQMNTGAAPGRPGDALVFLHADTRLPDNATRLLRDPPRRAGAASMSRSRGRGAGCCVVVAP